MILNIFEKFQNGILHFKNEPYKKINHLKNIVKKKILN